MSYDKGLHMKSGEVTERVGMRTITKRETLHGKTPKVFVTGNEVVQVYDNQIRKLALDTGDLLWTYESKEFLIPKAALGTDGHVYAEESDRERKAAYYQKDKAGSAERSRRIVRCL